MDIQTKDGILLRGVPDGTPEEAIKARIATIRAERPATMNMNLARQGEKARENMTPPESVTDDRYPAYARAQKEADTFGVVADIVGGVAGAGLGAVLKPGAGAMKWGARRLMQSALKPSPLEGTAKIDRAVNTLLDEGANVTRGGVEKLRRIGTGLNDDVQNILNRSTATIPKGSPATRIADEIRRVEDVNPLPSSPRAGLEGVQTEYLSNPLIPAQIPLPKAQQYKQALYQGLKDDYGKLSVGDEAGRKALARGLREDIEGRAPDVIPINARASDVWNALNMAERRALVAGNKDPMGLSPIAAHPIGAGSFLLNRSEALKSVIARGLNSTQRVPGAVLGGLLGSNMSTPENIHQRRLAEELLRQQKGE